MTPHPAKFSEPLLPVIAGYLEGYPCVLEPMAGVGTLARYLQSLGHYVTSNELEPEWAEQCPFPTTMFNAKMFPPEWGGGFDAIATSPTYGNRMADKYDGRDGSKRHTYVTSLGRQPSPGSTCTMQWGKEYRDTHEAIIAECVRVLRPGGRVVWNVKNHIRKGEVIDVAGWFERALLAAGLLPPNPLVSAVPRRTAVPCPGQRHGANGNLRVDHEWVLVFDKPAA